MRWARSREEGDVGTCFLAPFTGVVLFMLQRSANKKNYHILIFSIQLNLNFYPSKRMYMLLQLNL